MPVEIRLPQAGMGMTDGTISEWLKGVGEQVRKGECIAEVEAAKTTVEIEAPCDGVLTQILTPAGTVVLVREVMAVITQPCEPEQPAEPKPGSAPSASAPSAAGPETRPAGAQQVVPAARRLAAERGVPLAEVTGSGPGGRITEADVRAYLGEHPSRGVAIPLTGTRGLIARRMLTSLQSSAQYTLVRSADVTALADWHDRGQLPGDASYTDAIAWGAVLSLAGHPSLNAHIADDQIRLIPGIHLGIGIDTGEALVAGVLRDVGGTGLAELAARRRALTQRVRAGTADPAELQGSTFTVSSLGGAGIDAFTPIINPPEVAILGVGRVSDQPVPGDGGIAWRKSVTLSLTVDHRAVDGAPAARFLATLAGILADPATLVT